MLAGIALAAAIAATPYVPLLQPGDTVPALPLIDQAGRPFSLEMLRGKAVVLTFVYTRCADAAMCPLVSSKYARLQTMANMLPVRLVEITLDPAFDSPRVLRAYGAAYGQNPAIWTLATGAQASIDDLAARLGIATRQTAPGTFVHGEAAVIVDRDGRIAQTIDGNAWQPAQVFAAAREAAGDEPSPLARATLWLTAVVEMCGGGRASINALQALVLLAISITAIGMLFARALRVPRRR